MSRTPRGREGSSARVKLEKGRLETYVAPAQALKPDVIFQEVMIAGVVVKALIDSGAMMSCCNRYWYKRYHAEVGPLLQDPIHTIGVGNTPIYISMVGLIGSV